MRGTVKKYDTKTRGTRWRIVYDAPPDPETGKRRQKQERGFATKREAEQRLREILGDVDEGRYVEPSRQRLGEYLRDWLDGIRVGQVTLAGYRANLETYVIPRLGHVRLAALTPEQLDKMYRELERSGRRDGGPLKPKTVRGIHGPLRKALQDAVDRGHVGRNVADLANPPTARQARSKRARDKVWTAEQLRGFLEHCQERDDRFFALWYLIAMTAMRREDALGLRWQDTDLDAGTVTIRQTLTVADNEPLFQDVAKTEAGERTIALDRTTLRVLAEHKRQQATERLAIGPAWSDRPQDADLVFTQPDGKHLGPKKVSAAFTRRVDKLGLSRIGVHGLRHTWATLALRAGVPVAVVSERIGHSDPAITYSIYAHALPGDDQAAAETAAAAILGR